jgi:hypothetical protein
LAAELGRRDAVVGVKRTDELGTRQVDLSSQ